MYVIYAVYHICCMSFMLYVIYVACHYAECQYPECHHVECRGAKRIAQTLMMKMLQKCFLEVVIEQKV